MTSEKKTGRRTSVVRSERYANETARERAAWQKMERTKSVGVAVSLSNAAAARTLMKVSPAALRLLMGMVVVHSDGGGGRCVFEDAVKVMGGRKLNWQTIEELHASGLMRFNERGRHEMHPLFGSIAHRLFEFGHSNVDDGGTLLTLSAANAR